VDNADVVAFGMIGNKKISGVDVAGALAARSFAMHFHFDGAFVVLVEDSGGGGIALGGQKHFDVKGVGEVVTSIAHERKCNQKQSSVPPKRVRTDQESVAHSINRARTEMRSETVVGASKATPNGSGIGSALNQSRTNGNAIGNSRRCLQSESEQIRNRWRTQSIAHERNCDRKQSSVPSKQLLTDQESVAHSINCARTEMRSETVVGASKASQNGLGIGGALNQSHTNGNAIRNSRRCLQSNS
jgi:hypothetical protein